MPFLILDSKGANMKKYFTLLLAITVISLVIVSLLYNYYNSAVKNRNYIVPVICYEGISIPNEYIKEAHSLSHSVIKEVPSTYVGQASISSNTTIIKVSANGEVEVKPNVIYVFIQIQATGKSASEAVNNASKISNEVFNILFNQINIPKDNVKTTSYYLSPIYVYQSGKPPMIVGYRVTYSIRVKTEDVNIASSIIDKVSTLKVSKITIQYSLTKEEFMKAYLEALREAVINAVKKAKIIAEALNMTLIGINYVSETSVSAIPYQYPYGVYRTIQTEGKAGTQLYVGTIKIKASISLTAIASKP